MIIKSCEESVNLKEIIMNNINLLYNFELQSFESAPVARNSGQIKLGTQIYRK